MKIKYLFILLILFASMLTAQLKYSVGVGTGLFFTDGSQSYTNSQKYFNGQFKLQYDLKGENNKGGFQFLALPEIYGSDDLVRSLKLKIEGNYQEKYGDFTWGINLSKKYYLFNSISLDNTFDIYFVQPFLDWKLAESIPARTTMGIAYQDISGLFEQTSDLVFLENRLFHYFTPYTNLSYGIYLERFALSAKNKNSGWRVGPLFQINHIKSYVFNLQVKFLIHSSELTTGFSSESIIRLLAGTIIFKDFSAFFIADYNWRNFNYNSSDDILPYSLIDSENNIHVKLSYKTAITSELYLRGGYFNQDFLNNNLSLKGWNLIAGFKISN